MELTKKLLTVCALTIVCLLWAMRAYASPITIFFLGSGSYHSAWTEAVVEGLTSHLKENKLAVVFYADHLDAGRFDELDQRKAMFRYLEAKFGSKQPDIFISAGPAASEFSLSYPDLFPSSNRILIQAKKSSQTSLDDVVRIETKINYELMVEDALRLSTPQQVFIIGDSINPSDRHRLTQISQQLEIENMPYKSLINMELSSLIERVAQLPRNSAIFYTPIYREFEGQGLSPLDVLKKLSDAANAPFFSTSESELGYGTIGGYLHSPTQLGIMTGEAVMSLLNNLPIQSSNYGFELVYDWNELVRWGYEDKIEPNANVLFKPHPMWEDHPKAIILSSVFFVILSALLLVLTIYIRKLRKVKTALSKQRELLEQKVAERTQELSILYQNAEKRARVDELTGISNRREFFELGELVHNQTKRTKTPYTIVMIDIDNFKRVNDKYGHAIGDEVIRSITTSITSVTRKSDVVARIGGEEFALILTNTPYNQVKNLTERIRSTVEHSHVVSSNSKITSTVSIGVAEYQPQDSHIGVVLARADKALYQAKESGKNKVTFW